LARLVGPAIAGYVIAAFGAGICYLADGFSYIAVIVGLLAMKIVPGAKREARHPWIEMREGFQYVFGFRPMRVLMLTLALISAVGFSYTVLTPMFARDIFHGDARVLGYLMSASGLGAVIAAIYLGSLTSILGLGNVVTLVGAFMGLVMLDFCSACALI